MKAISVTILAILSLFFTARAKDFDTRANYYRSQINNPSLPAADKLPFYDLLLAMHPTDSTRLYFDKGCALRDVGDMQDALLAHLKAYGHRNDLPLNDALELAYNVAQAEHFFGIIPDAVDIAQKMLDADKPDSLRYYDVKAQMVLYNCNMEVNDLEEATRSCDKVIALAEKWRHAIDKKKFDMLIGAGYMAKGALLSRRKQWEESYDSYKKAAEFNPGLTKSSGYNLGLGNFYSYQGEYGIAGKYYRLAVTDSVDDPGNRLNAIVNMMVNMVDRKDFRGALDCMKSYDSLIVANGYDKKEVYLSIVSEVYEGLGDYRSALSYKRRADSLRNLQLNPEVLVEIDSMIQQIRREDFEAEEANMAGGGGAWIATGVMIIIIIAGSVVLARKLKQRDATIAAMAREADNSRQTIGDLREEMASNSQQLSASAAKLAHVSDALASLREVVSNPRSRKEQIVESTTEALRSLGAGTQVWEPFMEYMQGVNQGFLDKLYRLHPDLSNSEIRMCAFILLNRTTKEIASIINRSPRTVESLKYSLRRKMRLREITTEAYLRLISATDADTLDEVFPQGRRF